MQLLHTYSLLCYLQNFVVEFSLNLIGVFVLDNVMTKSSCCFWKCKRNSGHRYLHNGLPEIWVDCHILVYTHCPELMKSVKSHGSLSLLFMMKLMVWHFVSDSHKVMTILIIMLPSNCCGVFSITLYIYIVIGDVVRACFWKVCCWLKVAEHWAKCWDGWNSLNWRIYHLCLHIKRSMWKWNTVCRFFAKNKRRLFWR